MRPWKLLIWWEEVMNRRASGGGGVGENGNARSSSSSLDSVSQSALSPSINLDAQELIDEDILPLEQALYEMEDSLVKARKSLIEDKAHASDAQTACVVTGVAAAEEPTSNNVMANMYAAASAENGSGVGSDGVNITGLNFQELQ
jgi:hypothetical protein